MKKRIRMKKMRKGRKKRRTRKEMKRWSASHAAQRR